MQILTWNQTMIFQLNFQRHINHNSGSCSLFQFLCASLFLYFLPLDHARISSDIYPKKKRISSDKNIEHENTSIRTRKSWGRLGKWGTMASPVQQGNWNSTVHSFSNNSLAEIQVHWHHNAGTEISDSWRLITSVANGTKKSKIGERRLNFTYVGQG